MCANNILSHNISVSTSRNTLTFFKYLISVFTSPSANRPQPNTEGCLKCNKK